MRSAAQHHSKGVSPNNRWNPRNKLRWIKPAAAHSRNHSPLAQQLD